MSYPEALIWNPACGIGIKAVPYVTVTEVFQARVGIIILNGYNFKEQSLIVYILEDKISQWMRGQ